MAAEESKGAEPANINALLASIPLHEFPVPPKGVITVNADDNLATAVRTLQRVRSCCVRCMRDVATAEWCGNLRWCGSSTTRRP